MSTPAANSIDILLKLLPLIIPLVLLQLVLMVVALVDWCAAKKRGDQNGCGSFSSCWASCLAPSFIC